VRLNIAFDICHGLRDISVKNVPEHSPMTDGLGVLACHEPEHAMCDILRCVRSQLASLLDVQALTFQTKIDVLSRYERHKHDILATQVFPRRRFEFDELCVNLKHQTASRAVLSKGSTQCNRDVVFLIVGRWSWHLLPACDDEIEDARQHGVD
jgi:hypothetical protein